jgi:hypothetical protein
MDAAKVVVHVVKGERGNVVFDLLRERISKADEANSYVKCFFVKGCLVDGSKNPQD